MRCVMAELKDIRRILIEIEAVKLKAQLRAIRKMIPEDEVKPIVKNSMSGIGVVYDILLEENAPLHINDIILRAKEKHNIVLDRESIVSAIIKKIKKNDRFIRTGKNTFAVLKKEPET